MWFPTSEIFRFYPVTKLNDEPQCALAPYRFSNDGIISSCFEASLMQSMYCRNAASFWWGKKADMNDYFWTEWFQKEEGRISLSAFGVLASSLWQSVLYIVKQYKCIVMLLYYSGHITIICNYIIKAKGVSYVCFENINESVIYKTPYHQNKIRMLIIPTYIRAWGQLT